MKTDKKKIKVAVGMSGGVDSSVAAALLKDQGYDVIGVFLRFWSDPTFTDDPNRVTNKCCSVEAMMDARRVCAQLDIELITLNVSARFKEFIVNNFLEEYESGNTPNPCVICNQFIKVGHFLDKARELGCEYVATGHYAKIANNPDGTADMYLPKDSQKDQTYFLYRLDQNVIAKTIFPLGDLTKTEVRAIAEEKGLPVAQKKESFEISFIPDKDHNDFLKRWVRMKPGDIVDTDGKKIGVHEGLPLFTIGQRRGLQIGGPGGPWYVVDKKHSENILIVTNDPDYPGLFTKKVSLKNTIWTREAPQDGKSYQVRLRYRHTPQPATVNINENGKVSIIFDEPQRAVTPGQSTVIYSEGRVIGGGIVR